MNAPFPVRTPQIDRWSDVDALDDAADEGLPPAAERMRRIASSARMLADADEVLARTSRLVDRLCPAPPLGWSSSLYPELNSEPTLERMLSREASVRRRNELHRLIRPMIEAKVRGRQGVREMGK